MFPVTEGKGTVMKVQVLGVLMVAIGSLAMSQGRSSLETDATVPRANLRAFADSITVGCATDYEEAGNIVRWLARNFDWTATDYKERTVDQIIARKGGNCNELARVTTALLKVKGVRLRSVREINIYKEDAQRKERADQMIREKGNRASVFGKRHNDHVWIEVYDEKTNEWIPADPSLGLIGEDQWLQARVGFGKRVTMDSGSLDMIVPMGIFATDEKGNFVEDRTKHYVIDGLDRICGGKLDGLKAWKPWKEGVAFISQKCRGAFQGEVNLHEYESQIDSLALTYAELKSEYLHSTTDMPR